jgi:CheY-like chemotaxis protein
MRLRHVLRDHTESASFIDDPSGLAPGVIEENEVRARRTDFIRQGELTMRAQRMLLLEDDYATRHALRRILSREGWDVVEAASVTEALAHLDSDAGFDCLITDLMLPDGVGETVLRRVRQSRLRTRVIVCSATFDANRLDAIHRMGADAVLPKPIDLEAVHRVFGSPGG